MNKQLLLAFLIALITKFLPATAQQPLLRNFTMNEYGNGTQNWDIAQYGNGKMVFANNHGMLCYDGDRWSNLPVSNYTNVRSVFYDESRNVIFAGATDQFGYYAADKFTHQLSYHSLSDSLPDTRKDFSEVWNIFEWHDNIVFQSRRTLFFYSRSGKLTDQQLNTDIGRAAVVGDRIILTGHTGVFSTDGRRITALPGTESLKDHIIRAILPYGKNILFVTDTDGLFLYDGATVSPYILDITPELKLHQVFTAAINGHTLAFGTVRGGMIMKNLSDGTTTYVNTYSGLQNNTVLSLRFDRLNNIWLGLDNGLAYVLLENAYRDLLGPRNSIGTGYTSLVSGNHLYLGTNQGLFAVPYPLQNSTAPPAPVPVSGIAGQVWAIYSVGGKVLCGSDGGAFVIDGLSAHRIEGMSGTWNFRQLAQHPGYVLASDYNGFCILDNTGGMPFVRNRLANVDFSSGSFEEDDDGTIWVSHWQKGVYHFWLDRELRNARSIKLFNKETGLVVNDNNIIFKLNGRIYVSSVDGLYQYDRSRNQLAYDKNMSKIFDTYGYSLKIRETANHDLIAMKAGFLAVAHPTKNGYKVDSVSYRNIAKKLQVGLGETSAFDSEHTIINHNDGFYVIKNNYDNHQEDNRLAVNEVVSIGKTDSVLYTSDLPNDVNEVDVPHNLNSLRIRFGIPEYQGEKPVLYTCRLEGYDNEWSKELTSGAKEYTQLPKGKYKFHVKAYNRVSGQRQELTFIIRVLPAWYETWWAYLLYIMLIAVAAWQVYKLINRRAQRQMAVLAAERERKIKEQETQLQMEKAQRESEVMSLKNEQLDLELKHKSSELADSTINLVRKNDMLQVLDQEIEELTDCIRRDEPKAKVTKKLKEIRQSIQGNMADDGNWEKFEENFNLVYDDFMKKLVARFPNLKMNDRKLCAYLHMGMSSKEMATLLNMSVRSIETARYRLRKKLDLDSGDNLTSFIQNF